MSKRGSVGYHSHENVFSLQILIHANQSEGHMEGFACRLVLRPRQKATRKWLIGFAFVDLTLLLDWFKNFAPLFHPISCKPKPIMARLHSFPCVSRHLHVLSLRFDCFTVLCNCLLRHSIENRSIHDND